VEEKQISVAIIIGSEYDFPLVEQSGMLGVLDQMKIAWELSVISADRNPQELHDCCIIAKRRGVIVFIGAAGMSAKLPAAIAAYTGYKTPVIGVALPSEDFPNSLDALFTIVRQPGGCPVICSGIGKAGLKNAALIACQILCTGNDERSCKTYSDFSAYLKRNQKTPQIPLKEGEAS